MVLEDLAQQKHYSDQKLFAVLSKMKFQHGGGRIFQLFHNKVLIMADYQCDSVVLHPGAVNQVLVLVVFLLLVLMPSHIQLLFLLIPSVDSVQVTPQLLLHKALENLVIQKVQV